MASVGVVPFLTSCGTANDGHIFTVRATAFATWGSKVVRGSTLIQAAILGGGRRPTLGQAIVMELTPGKNLYVIMVSRENTSNYGDFYRGAIADAFTYGLTSPPSLIRPQPERENTEAKAKYLHSLPTGSMATYTPKPARRGVHGRKSRPMIIGFNDDTDPQSAYNVPTMEPARAYGQSFKLDRIQFGRLPNDTPLTVTIDQFLPWARQSATIWAKRSPDYIGPTYPKGIAQSDPRFTIVSGVTRDDFLYLPGQDL